MPLTLEACVASHIGDRKEQQDRVALYPHPTRKGLMMAVLADGMGGHSGGAMAAEQVLHKAKQNFEHWAPASESPRTLIEGVLREAHLMIKLSSFTSEQDPHSTAVLLLIQSGQADWAHTGDSRLYHFRGTQLAHRSEDQSLVAELVRKGMVTPEEALVHPRRNLLLHCLGGDQEPMIDHGATALTAGDCFVLCSDGLWAYFRDDEMAQIVAHQAPRDAARILVDRARERAEGAGDNLSVAIIRLVEAPAPADKASSGKGAGAPSVAPANAFSRMPVDAAMDIPLPTLSRE